MFLRKILPQSSGSNNKRSKKPAESVGKPSPACDLLLQYSFAAYSSNSKMESTCTTEKSGSLRTAWRCNPEDRNVLFNVTVIRTSVLKTDILFTYKYSLLDNNSTQIGQKSKLMSTEASVVRYCSTH